MVVREPEGDECFEAFCTGQIGGYPDVSEDLGDKGVMVDFFAAAFSGFLVGMGFEIEHSDGVFAMVAADPAATIQQVSLLGFGGITIKLSQGCDVLCFGSMAHHFCLLLWVTEIMRQRPNSQIATVTFFMRQSGAGNP